MVDQGKCIIISAPSGAGKTTIVHHLLQANLNLEFSISATSREIRGYEIEGIDYYFVGIQGFKDKIKENAFIEWEEVYQDQFYGTLNSEIERIWAKGHHVIFDVDVIGGLNLKKYFKDRAISIFIMPPSVDSLRERLELRGTETVEKINIRLSKASKELSKSTEFDHVILNQNLSHAFDEAKKIVSDFLQNPS